MPDVIAEFKEDRPIPKDYMGDAVYAEDDGFHLMLTTSNGISVTNRIALEDTVFYAVMRYGKRMGWK